MEDLRLRAWDGSEMLYSEYKPGTTLGVIGLSLFFVQLRHDREQLGKEHTLMLCTGMTDCEDTWIYNGDIIEVKSGYRNYVIYRGGGFQYNGIDEAHGFEWIYLTSHGKVIGNIYEDVDLYEELKCR